MNPMDKNKLGEPLPSRNQTIGDSRYLVFGKISTF
jgi:hypothetical protein